MIRIKTKPSKFRAKKAFALWPQDTKKDGFTGDRTVWLESIFIRQQKESGCDYGGCWSYWRTLDLIPWKELSK